MPAHSKLLRRDPSAETAVGSPCPRRVCHSRVQFQEHPTAVADDPTAVADEAPEPTAATIQTQGHPTAVADHEAPEPSPELTAAPRVDSDSDADSVGHSVAGDTVIDSSDAEGNHDETAVAARRQERVAPKARVQGVPDRSRGPAKHNSEPEVGNFGLFFGNWGLRGTLGDRTQRLRREAMDRQILKNPAQVVVVVEASKELEALLQDPPVEGTPGAEGL